jgi:hypothetical protein
MLGKECVRSHHGDISTPPAGKGSPVSRSTCNRASVRPPPAESPATTMCAGFTGRCEASGGGLIKYKSTKRSQGNKRNGQQEGRTGSDKILQGAGEGVLWRQPIIYGEHTTIYFPRVSLNTISLLVNTSKVITPFGVMLRAESK